MEVNDSTADLNTENQRGTNTEKVCKICQTELDDITTAVHPCRCKGSLKYMHLECLNEWIALSNKRKCEICGYTFSFEKTFKANVPKKIPLKYVILYIANTLYEYLINILCACYMLGKLFFIVFLTNSCIRAHFYAKENTSFVLLKGMFLIASSFVLSIYERKIIKALSSFRMRIDSESVLEQLVHEVTARTEGTGYTTGTVLPQPQEASDSTELDDQAIIESLEQGEMVSIGQILFRRPTLANLKEDAVFVLSTLQFTLLIPMLFYLSGAIRWLFKERASVLIYKGGDFINKLAAFMGQLRLGFFYLNCLSFAILSFFAMSVLFVLRQSVRCDGIRTAFYLIKTFYIVFFSSLFSAISLGILAHFSFSYKVNNGLPLFPFDGIFTCLFFHLFFGALLTFVIKETTTVLAKKFRPGLINSFPTDMSFTKLVEFTYALSLSSCLKRFIFNFFYMALIPCSTFFISPTSLGFTFTFDFSVYSLFYVKALFLLSNNAVSIAKLFANIFYLISSLLSRVFDIENYLYNKTTTIKNRNNLVWDLNISHCSHEFSNKIRKINMVLQEIKASGLEKDNQSEQMPRKARRISEEEQSSVQSRVEQFSELTETSSTTNAYVEDNVHSQEKSEIFMKIFSHIKSDMRPEEKQKLYEKYKITDRRLSKLYGVKHSGKLSIFYKPSSFLLFKVLCYICGFFSVQLLFYVLFKTAVKLCRLCKLNSDESLSIAFVYFSSLLVALLAYTSSVSSRETKVQIKGLFNKMLVALYSNIIFPVVGAFLHVLVLSSLEFVAFSRSFVILTSMSSIVAIVFRNFFLAASVNSFSPFYITRSLFSFLMLKIIFYLLFMAYNRVMVFSSLYVPVILTSVIIYQIYRILLFINSASLMDKVKDYFFLEKTEIVNYEHSDEE